MSGCSHIPLVARDLPLAVFLAGSCQLDRPLPAFVPRLRMLHFVFGARTLGNDRPRLVADALSLRNWRDLLGGYNRDSLLARRFARQRCGEPGLRTAFPGLCRTPGNYFHVVLRFVRKLALPVEPVLNALRPGIIGRGSKPEISETTHKVAQQARGRRDRLDRIKRIFETYGRRRLRHELGNALRAGTAHHIRLETTFL